MDGDEFERWLTYTELAELRGISKASATRMAFRHKWRRQVGNDGVARVAVPVGREKPPDAPSRDATAAKRGDTRDGVMVLQEAVASLTKRAEQAETRADRAENRAEQAESRLYKVVEDCLVALKGAEQAQKRADGLETELQQAQQAADALRQADDARRRQGRWARLRAAWRGE